jgi:hypothetical protein
MLIIPTGVFKIKKNKNYFHEFFYEYIHNSFDQNFWKNSNKQIHIKIINQLVQIINNNVPQNNTGQPNVPQNVQQQYIYQNRNDVQLPNHGNVQQPNNNIVNVLQQNVVAVQQENNGNVQQQNVQQNVSTENYIVNTTQNNVPVQQIMNTNNVFIAQNNNNNQLSLVSFAPVLITDNYGNVSIQYAITTFPI